MDPAADPELWGGLNTPDADIEKADIVVAGIPYDGAVSWRKGAAEAPGAVRAITRTADPATEYFEPLKGMTLRDLGDVATDSRETMYAEVAEIVDRSIRSKTLCSFIGGDHSVTIPILRGLDRALDHPFGVVHIDAHFDLYDEMGGDRYSHGSTHRRTLELEHIQGTEALFFVGIRTAGEQETAFLQEHPVQVVGAAELRRCGVEDTLARLHRAMGRFRSIYVTVDIDALDPAFAPGTGTPQFGGLDPRELLDLLYGVFKLPVVGFDVVEAAPSLEGSQVALFALRKILMECWGHHKRKGCRAEGRYA